MDFEDIFSSDEEHTVSKTTDSDRQTHDQKTKRIYKRYEPLYDNGRTYRYEEDPVQYRKIRKKVQNRESATRVRGRKRNAFQTLHQEVEQLRQTNAALQLQNARLQTENKSLKDEVTFMRTLVKPPERNPMDNFLDLSFEDESSEPEWSRVMKNDSQPIHWTALGIFTLVLAVFILPQGTTERAVVAFQNGQITTSNIESITNLAIYAKQFIKYALIALYLWFTFSVTKKYLKKNKFKKI